MSRLPAISQGKAMVEKPTARFPFFNAARRMATWSAKACLTSRAPESSTMSLIPMAVSLPVRADRPSTDSARTATGRSLALANSPIASTLASVAA